MKLTNREHAEAISKLTGYILYNADIMRIGYYIHRHFIERPNVETKNPDKLSEIHSDLLQVRQMVAEIRDNQKQYFPVDEKKSSPLPEDYDEHN